MYHDFNYEATLSSSLRAQWHLDDVLRPDQQLDFSLNFMPESLARTAALEELNPFEQRVLNQISAHQYLSIFGMVEEFILPFLMDHAAADLARRRLAGPCAPQFRERGSEAHPPVQALPRSVRRGFPVECQVIGPSEAIGAEVLGHDPLAVGLVILMIEWMTQEHYVGSIRDDGRLDPLFKNLLRHHWMEEAQHAKLDTLMVEALAEGSTEQQIHAAIDDFFEIGSFFDDGLQAAGRLQPRRAGESDRPQARRTRTSSWRSSTRRALDLPRLRHGPRALQSHARPFRRALQNASPKRPPIFA